MFLIIIFFSKVGLLFGAFKTMHTQRLKPDLFWSLLIASRQYSTLFQHEEVINALCSILTPHTVASTKLRHYNIVAAVIAANLLLTSHDRLITWPESFVKVVICYSFNFFWYFVAYYLTV